MTPARPGRTHRRVPRLLFVAPLLAAPILTWLFVSDPLVKGLVTGFLVAPLVLLGTFLLLARRMRTRMTEGLAPPPLPLGRWDFEMTAQALDGEATDFARFRGKVLILNVWATWCPPCVAEMPSLSRLQDATSELDVVLACVTREPEEVVRKFLEKRELTVPIYLLDGDPPDCFKSRAIPATFVLDKGGTIAMRHFGAAAWDDPTVVSFVRGLAAAPGL